MALFKVNTGLREQEVVYLRWAWEVRVPVLDATVFVIPRAYVKNTIDMDNLRKLAQIALITGIRSPN